MADWKDIGNYAEYAVFAASLAVWLRIVIRRIKSQPLAVPAAQPPVSSTQDLEYAAFRNTLFPLAEQRPVSWDAPAVGATFLVVLYLPSFLISLAGPPDLESPAVVPWHFACSLAQIVTMVGLLRFSGPLRKEDFGCNLSEWRNDALIGAGAFLASIIPVYMVTVFQHLLDLRGPDDKHPFFKILERDDGHGVLFWIIASVVIVGPLAEELLYRVLLQGWLQSHIAPWQAILFSTAIFCLNHGATDSPALVPFAAILGYIYYRRRSYVALVVAHALFNALFITLALLKGS